MPPSERRGRDAYDYRRREPYSRRRPRYQNDENLDNLEGDFIKVSAGSNPHSVAGKVAHSCREGNPPAALCTGAACISQAVKAICICRGYLADDGLDVSFQPAFRDKDRRPASLALYLCKQKPSETIAAVKDSEQVELTVSGQSKPSVVAGALAARVREARSVCLTAMGVDAVCNAVLAIGNSRVYLEENRIDIRAIPEFVTVRKNNTQLSVVKFNILPERV